MLSTGKHIGIEEVIEEVRRERGKQKSHFFDNESIIGMVATKNGLVKPRICYAEGGVGFIDTDPVDTTMIPMTAEINNPVVVKK